MATLLSHLTAQITSRITGKPVASVLSFSTYPAAPAASGFVRNTSCWASLGGNPIDVTPIETTASYFGGASNAVLISPRHVLFAKHTLPVDWNRGDPAGAFPQFTVSYTTADNVVVTRTVVNAVTAPGPLPVITEPYPHDTAGWDMVVGVLDSDVPGTISFCKVLPADWENYLPDGAASALLCYSSWIGSYGVNRYLFVNSVDTLEQEHANAYSGTLAHMTIGGPGGDFQQYYKSPQGGDSGNPMMLVVNSELVLLGVFWLPSACPAVTAHRDWINAAMTTLGGGYQLTDVDLSEFDYTADPVVPAVPAVIRVEIEGVDATSVVLTDVAQAFGVKRTDTDAIVVAANTAMVHAAAGVWTYTIVEPAPGLSYEFEFKANFASGEIIRGAGTVDATPPPQPVPAATPPFIRVEIDAPDAVAVVLTNAAETFGVRRTDTDAVVVDANTPMDHDSAGVWTYLIDEPESGLTYAYEFEAIFASGEIVTGSGTVDGLPASIVTPTPTPVPTPEPTAEGYWTSQTAVERRYGVLNVGADADLDNDGSGVAAVWSDVLAEVDAVFNREIASWGSPDLSLDDAVIRLLARDWCRVLLYSSRGWGDTGSPQDVAGKFAKLKDDTWAKFQDILQNPAAGSEDTDVTAPVGIRQTMDSDGRSIVGTSPWPAWDPNRYGGYGW